MDKLAWLNKFYTHTHTHTHTHTQKKKKKKEKRKKEEEEDKKREKEIKTYHIYDTNMNHVKILLWNFISNMI